MWWRKKKDEPFHARLDSPDATGSLDEYSGTWAYIRSHCEQRIEQLRQENDGIALDLVQTSLLRGRIKFAKEILSLPERANEQRRKED